VTLGKPVVITFDIVNNEREVINYRIGITVDSVKYREISAGEPAHKGKWREAKGDHKYNNRDSLR